MQVSLVNNSDIFAGDGRRDQNYARAHTHEITPTPEQVRESFMEGKRYRPGQSLIQAVLTRSCRKPV